MNDDQIKKGVTDEQIADLRSHEAEELAQVMADKYKLPYIDLSRTLINTDALRLIPEDEARVANIVSFSISGKNLGVAVDSPNRPETLGILENLRNKNLNVAVHLASRGGLESAWGKYEEISKSEKSRAGLIEI